MRTVRCPDCGQQVEVPEETRAGNRFECPTWAGTHLRLVESGKGLAAKRVHLVTCPRCERQIELPEDARPGDRIRCCGTDWRLTYEFGGYALEP